MRTVALFGFLFFSRLPIASPCSKPLGPPPKGSILGVYALVDAPTGAVGAAISIQSGDDRVIAALIDPDTKVVLDAGTLTQSQHEAGRFLWRPTVVRPAGTKLTLFVKTSSSENVFALEPPTSSPVELKQVWVAKQKVPLEQCTRQSRYENSCGTYSCEGWITTGHELTWYASAQVGAHPGLFVSLEANRNDQQPFMQTGVTLSSTSEGVGVQARTTLDDAPEKVCVRVRFAGLDDVLQELELTCVTPEVLEEVPSRGCAAAGADWFAALIISVLMALRRRAND